MSAVIYLYWCLAKYIHGIMCTIGGLGGHIGRYIGWLSTDYRLTIGRQSTDYRSVVGWYIGRQSVDISVDYRSTIGRPRNVYISGDALVDYRSICRSIIGRLSVDCRSTVSRLSETILELESSSCITRASIQLEYLKPWKVGNCEEELPKKPVGRLSVNCRPTGYRQSTNS